MEVHKQLSDGQSGGCLTEKPLDIPFSKAARGVVGNLCLSGRYRGDSFGAWLAWHDNLIITAEEENALLTPEQLAKKYPWLVYIYLAEKK